MRQHQKHPSKPANLNTLLRSTKPGTSLLVGLGLTTIIVLVSLGVTTVVISSIRESANVTGANQAYYAAEGALEEGLWVNQGKGAGYSDSAVVSSKPPKSSYTIGGQVNEALSYSDGSYGIPAPGTGTAGKDCDKLNPYVKNYFAFDAATGKYSINSSGTDPKEHPCNWSKIKVGESVSIPLFVSKNVGGTETILNPANSLFNLNSLKIRVRTPCKTGKEYCDNTDRYSLYYDTSSVDKYNATNYTLMSWQIIGTNQNGSKTYVFSPLIGPKLLACNDAPYSSFPGNTRCEPDNSEIYSSQINFVKISDKIVVSTDDAGVDNANNNSTIADFLRNTGNYLIPGPIRATSTDAINKPVLKLSVIHSLKDTATTTIPYLEYQILTNATTEAPTDSSQTITAEGYSGNFKQVLEVKNPQGGGLLEYVIQQ